MNRHNIKWKSFDRDLVPLALFGDIRSAVPQLDDNFGLNIPQGKVAIGFNEGADSDDYNPPSIIAFNEGNSSELFSWLRVYAPETSPASQFTRVITSEDWNLFSNQNGYSANRQPRTDQWSCVVLGELLAQGDSDSEISSIPLARTQACFSSTVAHASFIYNSEKTTKACISRLYTLETDSRFVKRTVSATELSVIWRLLEDFSSNRDLEPTDTIFKIVETIKLLSKNPEEKNNTSSLNLNNYPDLTSNSIEDRVVSFNKIYKETQNLPEKAKKSSIANATLAAAAFLVGRSTSHLFLLRRIGKDFPSSFAWFGLYSAICGASTWSADWARATKGIERTLRTKFDWGSPAPVDLCWAEYNWISKTINTKDAFFDIPKQSPRVLSIEIIPGASCQLRLSGTYSSADTEKRIPEESSTKISELKSALDQLIELALKAQKTLSNDTKEKEQPQRELNLEDQKPATKPPRSRKSTRSTSK